MIDVNTFTYEESIWQDIFMHLKKQGFDVYSPGIKVGECTSEYLAVKYNGSSKHASFSTNIDLYSVMCYVPKDRYSSLEVLVRKVKNSMKELEPMIKPHGSQTPSFYDDSLKAHMVSIEYKNYKKL